MTENTPQMTFDEYVARKPRFAGSDYNHGRDSSRLSGQLLRVHGVMKDGQWHTLSEISCATGDPEASVSAQLRHLRKPRFGGHEIEKRYLGEGLYQYRIAS